MNILECSQLTKNEIEEFLKKGMPKLRDMERRNTWDFYVNDVGFYSYINQLFIYAFEAYNIKYIHDYYSYPKVNELDELRNLILEDTETLIRYENKLREERKVENLIYELVLEIVMLTVNKLY